MIEEIFVFKIKKAKNRFFYNDTLAQVTLEV